MKWHLPSSSAAEHRGKTDKALIRDHRAIWDYSKDLSVRLTIDKTQHLHECDIQFEILQEYSEGGRGGRVDLGKVKLNLAEYTQPPDDNGPDGNPQEDAEDGTITRRYLLQDSKINCTLKVGIKMKQTEGDTTFIAPPLKMAMVNAGIAGILSTEAGEGEDIPSITSKTRELSEAQDLYRRTLAATWACSHGELAPDKLIEDLFAGGDGGRMEPPKLPQRQLASSPRLFSSRNESVSSSSSDAESRRTVTPSHLSPEMARHGHRRGGSSDASHSHNSQSTLGSSISGRSSIAQLEHNQNDHHHDHHRRRSKGDHKYHELTELDLRDDLRSWQVKVK